VADEVPDIEQLRKATSKLQKANPEELSSVYHILDGLKAVLISSPSD
jgi:hypothetical protein